MDYVAIMLNGVGEIDFWGPKGPFLICSSNISIIVKIALDHAH